MKLSRIDIKLKSGINDVGFGSSMDDIRSFIGNPDHVEDLQEEEIDEDLHTVLWDYDQEKITVFFEGEEDLIFSCIETSHPETFLFDKRIFDLSKDEIMKLMNDNSFTEIEMGQEEWGEQRISFDDALIDFYFENNRLSSVNWGVIVDEEGIMDI